MEQEYKIVISNQKFYKEISLTSNENRITIGTPFGCDRRLKKEPFFADFIMQVEKIQDAWTIQCLEGCYIKESREDACKVYQRALCHGDEFEIYYEMYHAELFHIVFSLDFSREEQNYERKIQLPETGIVTIGSDSSCMIAIPGKYTPDDLLELTIASTYCRVREKKSTYGVFHNGSAIKGEAKLQDKEFFSIANYSFFYCNRALYTSKYLPMQFHGLKCTEEKESESNLVYPRFHRNTRLQKQICTEDISVLDPPVKPQKPERNLLTALLPAASMLILVFILRGVMGSSSGMYVLFSGCTVAMGVVTTIVTLVQNGKKYKKSIQEREDKYRNYIQDKTEEIIKARQKEQQTLNEIYTDFQENKRRVTGFSGSLFDRNPEDPDFACVRIGVGEIPSNQKIVCKMQEKLETEDPLFLIPGQLQEQYRRVQAAPIVLDLKKCKAVGIVGEQSCLYALLKVISMDLCIRQFARDLQLFYILKEEQTEQFSWVRWLPHVQNMQTGMRNIVSDEDSRVAIYDYLYKELSAREEKKQCRYPRIVLFVYDERGLLKHPVSRFLSEADTLGVNFLFFENAEELLSSQCTRIIRVEQPWYAQLLDSSGEKEAQGFQYPDIRDQEAEQIARKLAPVFCEEVNLADTMTSHISLFELLHIFSAEDLDLSSRWAESSVEETMAAPLGRKGKEDVIYLDLHEKKDGPHGLVAGTTGSGKSELLQTYILSMAARYHPYEVSFVIIDFKGGGMANQLKKLPHLIGTITNIDGKEIDRSLRSIKAELVKRQNRFAEAGVNHIDQYIQLFKQHKAAEPLPHLIMIVDEFAELKAEQPEFMKELISASRIGRSLGVHLILATQKPAGQVDDQIWSNSRFKLCLKVQTKEDSNEVLKSPLAAEIKEPGRAYLQVGNNEVFTLFQSAYSGSPENAVEKGDTEEGFRMSEVSFTGIRKEIYRQEKTGGKGGRTQLQALVEYIASYCAEKGIRRQSAICLPALPALLPFPTADQISAPGTVTGRQEHSGITAELGIYDDPDQQKQEVYTVDLTDRNLMLIGSAQYGKTNVLQCLIRSVASRYSPQQVYFYVIDFASMALKNFQDLPHIGCVAVSTETEKLKNLFRMLLHTMKERQEKLASYGVSSARAYREAGQEDMPQIVLVIDNLTALRELYYKNEDDELLGICREGLSVGISVVAANAQTKGIGYRYAANFAAKLALFCNDSSEYNGLFEYCRIRPEDIPGRCITEAGKKKLICQIYQAFSGKREIDRLQEIHRFTDESKKRYGDKHARRVPVVPKLLTEENMERLCANKEISKYGFPAGVDYDMVQPFVLPLQTAGCLVIAGRAAAGRHNYLRRFCRWMEEKQPDTEIYMIDGIERKLASIQNLSIVHGYHFMPEQVISYVEKIEEIVKARYDRLLCGEEQPEDGDMIVLIIDSMDALEAIGSHTAAYTAYKNIIGHYRAMHVCVLISCIENRTVSYSAPEIVRNARDARHFLFFDELNKMKLIDIPAQIQREYRGSIENGDCYYIRDDRYIRIKTVIEKADQNRGEKNGLDNKCRCLVESGSM